tara:strand:+ start:38 stop:982 length:945 start_codon:yes stop_codon:yes gene_type:complete
LKKRLKILIPLIVGLFFIYLTFELTNPDERKLIYSYIGSAKIEFVLTAMLLGASADVIRGLRWQLLSSSMGYNSNKLISIASVFMCYTSNMAIARSGEFVRASVLSSYTNIPLGKTLGTIAAERVVDICISLIILITVWILQYDLIIESLFDDKILLYINDNIAIIGIVILFFIIVSIILIKKIKRLGRFFNTILEGLLSVTKLKSKMILFVMLSLLIWTCYILAFSVIKFSVPELSEIDSNLIFPAFVVGVYSISLSNHGLGVYPLAISLFLVNFGINTELGLTYGWLAWSCQAIITLIFGALSFFVLPLLSK